MMNFWQQIQKPIIAMAPMDGVTDAAFRYITAKYGRPDIQFTEFTNVEGLARNAAVMLDDFLYSEIERPVVAQIYGSEPESFYKIAVIVCELGFDGIDINMGCPAKKVSRRGCGAALIRNPSLAREIIRQVKRGVLDWANGISVEDLGLKPRMAQKVRRMNEDRMGRGTASSFANLPSPAIAGYAKAGASADRCRAPTGRKNIPISIKTRIGYDSVVIEDWVKHLLEEAPVAISIHGRTLKQMYSGSADWEAIARAAEIIHQTPTLVLGNGDLASLEDMAHKIKQSGVDGVLIGRGALGNPWIFCKKEQVKNAVQVNSVVRGPSSALRAPSPQRGEGNFALSPPGRGEGERGLRAGTGITLEERFRILLEHSRYFETVKGFKRFSAMRKHFGWYCKGIPRAAELRGKMFQTKSSEEVHEILKSYGVALEI